MSRVAKLLKTLAVAETVPASERGGRRPPKHPRRGEVDKSQAHVVISCDKNLVLTAMIWIGVAIATLVVMYMVRNGQRNADPLNRKAAAEICEYLTSPGKESDPHEIAQILQSNARYRTLACPHRVVRFQS